MLFGMFAVLIAVSWGLFSEPGIAAASILMWGIGDAAAALIGIPWGKHKIRWKHTDGKKSAEGTAAMFVSSFLAGLAVMGITAGYPPARLLLTVTAASAAGALTELFSGSEWDTVTVPSVILSVLLILSFIQ